MNAAPGGGGRLLEVCPNYSPHNLVLALIIARAFIRTNTRIARYSAQKVMAGRMYWQAESLGNLAVARKSFIGGRTIAR